MSLRQKIRSSALRATAAVAFVEVTTHIPSEGKSSLTYHYLFDHFITPWGRRLFDPEGAHHLALEVVRKGWAPRLSREGNTDENGRVNMKVEIGKEGTGRRLQFPGPIGLAAGFDKNGTAISGLFDLGFSFVEIGSVTPLPQPGNAKPRSFRLVEDRGVINRFGFNSEGAEKVKGHLSEYREEFGGRGSGRDAGILAETKESTKQEDLVVTEKEGETDHNNRSASGTLGSELTFKLKSEPPNKMLEKVTNSCLWALGWAWNKVMTSTPRTGVLGVNLGKNKTSEDEVGVSCWYSIFLVVYSFKKPATNVSLHPISRTTQLESVNSVPTQTTL